MGQLLDFPASSVFIEAADINTPSLNIYSKVQFTLRASTGSNVHNRVTEYDEASEKHDETLKISMHWLDSLHGPQSMSH